VAWYFNDKEFEEIPPKMEGFVYLIENKLNNKKYIGKKTFWERRKDPKTGRRKTKESSWKNYYGSCDTLINDVKEFGKENFYREILYLCPHKKSMSYYETYEQFTRNVIMREDYYNTNIEGKFFSSEKENIYSIVTASVLVEEKALH
jgi:hypothetical protein